MPNKILPDVDVSSNSENAKREVDQLEVIVRRPKFDWEAIADASTNGSLTGLGGEMLHSRQV